MLSFIFLNLGSLLVTIIPPSLLPKLLPIVNSLTPASPDTIKLSTESRPHPSLLFENSTETPGYRYRTRSPWSSWEAGILGSAKTSLARNFSGNLGAYNREIYRCGYASNLGLAYQITKRPEYAEKAKEALLNMGRVSSDRLDRGVALGDYALAYDWIQPTLDAENDTIIRDKLATFANTVYTELNVVSTRYIAFADFQGQAYPNMGIAGCALSDYTNPNHLPLSSTPEDWFRVGTEYLFVNDRLHTYGRSLFSFGFDEASGKYLNGAYKYYVSDEFIRWFQVYSHVTGRNIFDDYPAAKRAFTSEIWDSLPNYYSANYVTLGNTKWDYYIGILNLLDDETRAEALNYINHVRNSNVLPYSRTFGSVSGSLLYLVYDDYSAASRHDPSWTSRLDRDAIYQVFRGSWAADTDWLSLVTFNTATASNRDSGHHDQLSIEYYSHGDLLLADAGENKHVLDGYYGNYDIHHNTIAIENPRSPFPVAPYSRSAAHGIYKGDSSGIVTPVDVNSIIQLPWIEVLEARATITKVVGEMWGYSVPLSSPIQYSRTILFPNNEYFILVDRMEGSETWTYRNIFRPTSLTITPTTGNTVGNVRGGLMIGETPYTWLSLPYKTETSTGMTANSLTWTTRSPYGRNVTLNLFTSPASEVLVTKHVGRIAGYDEKSEVYSPIVSFRTPPSKNIYRITVLLSHYSNETIGELSSPEVGGEGSAVTIRESNHEDTAYTGTGPASFGLFETDAQTLYSRVTTYPDAFTLMHGTYLKYAGKDILRTSREIPSASFEQESSRIRLEVTTESPDTTISVTTYGFKATDFLLDGEPYHDWTITEDGLIFTPGIGTHWAEFYARSA